VRKKQANSQPNASITLLWSENIREGNGFPPSVIPHCEKNGTNKLIVILMRDLAAIDLKRSRISTINQPTKVIQSSAG